MSLLPLLGVQMFRYVATILVAILVSAPLVVKPMEHDVDLGSRAFVLRFPRHQQPTVTGQIVCAPYELLWRQQLPFFGLIGGHTRTTYARVNFAAASLPEEHTSIHHALVAAVATLEQEQSRGFQRTIPRALAFRSQGAPRLGR